MTILQGNAGQIVTQSRTAALAVSAAAAAAIVVYLNALNNPFVYDDHHTVVANTSIGRLGDLRAIVWHDVTRPVANFSYAVDRRLWGERPFGFHLTNVLLHALDVMLLFALARRALDDAWDTGAGPPLDTTVMAFGAALLFAVHPMMTEAVGYVSGRSEVLCGVFFLTAVMAGRRWLRGGGLPWAIVTAALWLAAIATKEIGAMFPFVLLAYDEFVLHPGPRERRRRWTTVHGPLIGVAVLAGLARVAILMRVESPGRALIHWPYALVALDVVRRYTVLLISPRRQTIFHAVPPIGLSDFVALLAIALVVILIWFAWSVRRTAGAAAFGVLWFLLLLVPGAVLTTLNVGEPMAEHRVYLASCGLFLVAGDGLGRLRMWSERTGGAARALVPVVLTVVAVAFAIETTGRNAVWRSPVSLWRESVDLAPAHYRPRLLLGEALQDEGRHDEAMQEYKTVIQLRPKDPTGYNKLGALYAALGRVGEARSTFGRALEVDPHDEQARRALKIMDRAEPRHGFGGDRR
jgi:hypothetical protein